MGRRAFKKVITNGAVTLHQRYIYRGYLQIACIDLTRSHHPALWLITWDPSQPVATRPLAIQKDGTWYTYGFDLTKNVCEVFGTTGYIATVYNYTPFGEVTLSGHITQPFQWSSEYHDAELEFVYYNYRYYTPSCGRWLERDYVVSHNLYHGMKNSAIEYIDKLGLMTAGDPDFWGENNYNAEKKEIVQIPGKNISKGNCFRYAFNSPTNEETNDKIRLSPWDIKKFGQQSCSIITKYVLSIEGVEKKKGKECPECTYEVTLHIQRAYAGNDGDYHWFRKDDDGTWSHKRGFKRVEKGVKNPRTEAHKHGYTIFCPTRFCVKDGGVNLDNPTFKPNDKKLNKSK